MKRSYKLLLGAGATAVVLCLAGVTYLHSRAPDFWGYGKLGVSGGTEQSAAFFVEVRGVGHLPTIAYIVRCSDQSKAPKNMLEVLQSVVPQFEQRTRVMDRWRSECLLLVGRRVGETIAIPLDAVTAEQWFGRPGAAIGDFTHCQKFWDEFVSQRIAEFDRNHPGTG